MEPATILAEDYGLGIGAVKELMHSMFISDGLLEGEYRLVKAPVDNKSMSVKLFIVEERSAWGMITPMKQKDDEEQISSLETLTIGTREKRNSASRLNSRSELE